MHVNLSAESSRFFEKKGDAPRGRRKKLLGFLAWGVFTPAPPYQTNESFLRSFFSKKLLLS